MICRHHGLNFFYFRLPADDVTGVTALLKMTERDRVPSLLADQVISASKRVDWNFKWAQSKIYVAYYCHPFDGANLSVDMLLVNHGDAVLVTEGYLPPGSYSTNDPLKCSAHGAELPIRQSSTSR